MTCQSRVRIRRKKNPLASPLLGREASGRSGARSRSIGVICLVVRLADGLLNLPDDLLRLALDLLGRITGDSTGHVIGFALDLLDLSRCDIFLSHDKLLSVRRPRSSGAKPIPRLASSSFQERVVATATVRRSKLIQCRPREHPHPRRLDAWGRRARRRSKGIPADSRIAFLSLDTRPQSDTFDAPAGAIPQATTSVDPGAIVKWDHATMAWLNLGFKSPWLHFFGKTRHHTGSATHQGWHPATTKYFLEQFMESRAVAAFWIWLSTVSAMLSTTSGWGLILLGESDPIKPRAYRCERSRRQVDVLLRIHMHCDLRQCQAERRAKAKTRIDGQFRSEQLRRL